MKHDVVFLLQQSLFEMLDALTRLHLGLLATGQIGTTPMLVLDTLYEHYARIWKLLFGGPLPMQFYLPSYTARQALTEDTHLVLRWRCQHCGKQQCWQTDTPVRQIICDCGTHFRIANWVGTTSSPVLEETPHQKHAEGEANS